MAAEFQYPSQPSRTVIISNNRRWNGAVRPLRRLVYSTILFICLTAAFYSIKQASREIERRGFPFNQKLPEESKILAVFKRQTVNTQTNISEEESDTLLNNETNLGTSKHKAIISAFQSLTNTSLLDKSTETDNSISTTFKPTVSATRTTSTTAMTTQRKATEVTTITTTVTEARTSVTIRPTIVHTTPTRNRKTTSTARTPTILPSNQTTILCEPPAYHEFPDDLFTNKQRAQGFVVIHVLVGIYMFYSLAIVCDEYFVASMEKICLKMGLSEDVAGATFMAAGSSAPELFASLLGVFVAKGDVGTGTIVGSAVFNILFVIGICGLFAGKVVVLNWWPLLRDSIYYSITIAVLIAILADNVVTWWESLIMLLLYAVYIIIMKFNVKIHIWLTTNTHLRHMDELTQSTQGILAHDEKQVRSSYVQFTNESGEKDAVVSPSKNPTDMDLDEIIKYYPRKMSLYEAALKVMSSRPFRPRTRFRCAGKRLIVEKRHLIREGYPCQSILVNEYSHSGSKPAQGWDSGREPNEEWKMVPSIAQQGVWTVIKWFVTIPVLATLHYTIPDCRNSRWERWYLFTFFTSMLWIAFFSYILVWMVTLVGYTCGVPDTIMGITFLAAGTSIPDAYSSLLVARQGMGDMAVSNSIGSNVFDILIGLALPWFLQTAIVEPNSQVPISSGGMVYNVILLFVSIAVTIIGVHYAHWQLNRRLGITLLISYVIFLIFSLLIEFNVFGYVNLPECEE